MAQSSCVRVYGSQIHTAMLWAFYRVAARLCKTLRYVLVCEVVNPPKYHKLEEVALCHCVHLVKPKHIGRRLRKFWRFLP